MEGQVRDFLESLESQPSYSTSTCQAYRNDLRCFLEYLQRALGRAPTLADFNGQQVLQFLEAERQAGRRTNTLLRRRASLRRFASYLQQCGSEGAPFAAEDGHTIDLPVGDGDLEIRQNSLSDEQVDSLWRVLEASARPRARRDHAILALLLETGISVTALIALNLTDADLAARRLHFQLDSGQEAWLPLGSAAEPLLRYLREGRPELNYRQEEQALFISQTGGRMCRQGVWQVLRQWGYKARLPITLSPRVARHTAALRLDQTGHTVAEIQTLLGHSNPLSTRALLRRLQATREEEARIPEILVGEGTPHE